MQALKSYISHKLFNDEAAKRNVSPDELRQVEIIQKSKIVSENDIVDYALKNEYVLNDSNDFLIIKLQLININRRFRFEVFIDSLKSLNNVEIKEKPSISPLKDFDNIYSHVIGNKESILHVYYIADYDCPTCINNYERVLKLCRK